MIQGIVSRHELAEQIAALVDAPVCVLIPGAWSIVGLGHDQLDSGWVTGGFTDSHDGFRYLGSGLIEAIEKISEGSSLVYLETDYFGGRGGQAAALFRNGAMAWRRGDFREQPVDRDSPINAALRELGVQAGDGRDEFDTLGLSAFRSLDRLGIEASD